MITLESHGGEGAPVLAIHGLGGSAGNWSLVAPRITPFANLTAIDLPGHGRSGPAPRHDLATHARAVIDVIDRVAGRPVMLLGNSMGALVAELVASSNPAIVSSLVLLAPATPRPRLIVPSAPAIAMRLAAQSLPGLGRLVTHQYLRRRTPRRQIEETMRLVMHDPARLPPAELERSVELARLRREMPWAERAFAESSASVRRMLLRTGRFRRTIASITTPTTVVFGSEDRVVDPAAVRWLAELRPDWRVVELADTGHTPMWERPDVVAHEVARRLPGRAPS